MTEQEEEFIAAVDVVARELHDCAKSFVVPDADDNPNTTVVVATAMSAVLVTIINFVGDTDPDAADLLRKQAVRMIYDAGTPEQ